MARNGAHKGYFVSSSLAVAKYCSMQILSAPSTTTLIFNFEAPFETFHSAGLIHTSKAVHGILRKYVLRNSRQSKKLKGNLPIGQLVSPPSKKATKANLLLLSGVVVESTWCWRNCRLYYYTFDWFRLSLLFYFGSRRNYEWLSTILPSWYPVKNYPVMCHVGETSVKLYSYDVIICHIWSTYQKILAFSHSVCVSH